jgi:hypothetical protein
MAFRSITTPGTGNTIDKPTGTAEGDIVLILCVADDNHVVTDAADGFTVGGRIATGGSYAVQWLWKVAGASEPANYTITQDFNAAKTCVAMAFSGRNTSSPITASASTTLSSASASPVSVALGGVTAAEGDDIIHFGMIRPTTGGDTWGSAPPTNFDERAEDPRAFRSAFINTRDNVSAGATGTITGTATIVSGTDTGAFAGWVIAIAQAAAGSANLFAGLFGKPLAGKL